LSYEIERQRELLKKGIRPGRETRSFDREKSITLPMRTKETVADYRYFPEPDLPPYRLSKSELEEIRSSSPVMPKAFYEVLTTKFSLHPEDALIISEDREVAAFARSLLDTYPEPKSVANLIVQKLKPHLDRFDEDLPKSPHYWSDFLRLIDGNKLTQTQAFETLFPLMLNQPDIRPTELAQRHDLLIRRDRSWLEKLVDECFENHPEEARALKNGKQKLTKFFVGAVMRASRGKADPQQAAELIRTRIIDWEIKT
jgi:aspartyl-tRNA(Asn)/glutamyl-tRNA(Gln) amidotransferase subunit B